MSTSTTRAYYQTKDHWKDVPLESDQYAVSVSPSLVMVPSPPSSTSASGSNSANELILVTIDKAKLVFVVIGWYIFSSLSNNINKNILRLHPYPILLTAVQFGFISIYTLALLQFLGRKVLSNINMKKIYQYVVPLSFGHIFAHLFTQISIGNVPVSFTHTVKASSPIFTVILSKLYLGEEFTRGVLLSLIPIMVGVSLSSAAELDFNFTGFATALFSTFIFSVQNIYSKKLFRDYQFDHIELMFYTSTISFLLMLPILLFVDSGSTQLLQHDSETFTNIVSEYFTNGICHFMQNILAFTCLSITSPLTYSIANTFKRIFVIVSAILYFNNTVTITNALGIALAISGIALYNQTKLEGKRERQAKSSMHHRSMSLPDKLDAIHHKVSNV
eukprot:TRINITY_DN4660_c1_g1_i1.p1 TRINITY_DN4660_c1_g1~~TRINITY_DN4660_c1_g1_i1.p1  ORF type:complete len:389 (-),score=97.37 TRINITY_DN4660_c1_g1_i1:122-1288(-)